MDISLFISRQPQYPSDTIHNQTIIALLQWMLGTHLPAVRKIKYLYKLEWETRQLEADYSKKKKNQDLAAQRRGTCFSFQMERCVCVCTRERQE